MAYVPQDDEQQKQSSLSQSASPSGSLPTTGGGGGGAPTATAGTPNAGGFANLLDYMKANSDQAPQVANTVANDLGQQYNQQKGVIDSSVQKAQGDIQNGTVNYDPNVVNSAVSNPAQFVQDPNNVKAFTNMRDATYKGPGSFQDTSYYGDATKAATQGAQTAQLAKTPGGYGQLLNKFETNPTAGKNALDVGLIQSSPAAAQTIQTAAQPFAGLTDYLSGKTTDVNNQAKAANQATQDAATKTRQAIQGAEQGFESDVNQRTTAAQNAAQSKIDADNQVIQHPYLYDFGQTTPDVSGSLGITPAQLQTMLNNWGTVSQGYFSSNPNNRVAAQQVDLTPYLQSGAPAASILPGNVASADDYARSAALAQLSGGPSFLDQSQTQEAGTAPGNLVTFDQSVLPLLQSLADKVTAAKKKDATTTAGTGGVVSGS